MRIGGIDIGSRYIKHVVLDGSQLAETYKVETGYDPLAQCQELIDATRPDALVATGYGRHLIANGGGIPTVTEIKAAARGARALFPTCRTIIDIGGQDTKVIHVNNEGSVMTFEMNDRCAAGTGKFLEMMARALGFEIDNFGASCENNGYQQAPVTINNLCAVFAESEVISLISKGIRREAIAVALHRSIASRVASLAKRVGVRQDVVFTGGCARNPSLKAMLGERLGQDLLVAPNPDILTAWGAALCAEQSPP
ncbi:MAG: Activator of (R)-2-hydroxyglutaryl-CoA dehydratase [Syntrophorhabdus sp. PtaU1.Bin153]|nr:MAG: Activator of (R)-2-hydroxyglutaryl-CoA dehydratase [Syntrophorhabdus sp. PtaU1.Bin153]